MQIKEYSSCFIDTEKLANLKRCARCLLPETFPLIEFDEKGECNYCRNYKKGRPLGSCALHEAIEKIRGPHKKDRFDCIVPLSGGRDSSWMLHFLKKEIGLNPVAITYDWGMNTPQGDKNAANICRTLRVPRIIVRADIEKKRRNIKKNVEAWLKKPSLSTVTLFMAGDKSIYYILARQRKALEIPLIFWGSNRLERTDFKTAFFNIDENYEKKDYADLRLFNKIRLAMGFGKEFFSNPSLINTSLFDTFSCYLGYYFYPKNYVKFFDYFQWNEEQINSDLKGLYGWEGEEGFSSSWRIGDGTAALYNYIYCRVAGFSEIDTFRSNQIREGILSREKGLQLVLEENKAREESIRWYCRTAGVDFDSLIERINTIPQLYAFNGEHS